MKKYLSVKSVAARYEIGVSTVWYWVTVGQLPKPHKLAENTSRWLISELEQMEADAERVGNGSENAQEKRTRLAAARKIRIGEE